jgi:hypothetical protein
MEKGQRRSASFETALAATRVYDDSQFSRTAQLRVSWWMIPVCFPLFYLFSFVLLCYVFIFNWVKLRCASHSYSHTCTSQVFLSFLSLSFFFVFFFILYFIFLAEYLPFFTSYLEYEIDESTSFHLLDAQALMSITSIASRNIRRNPKLKPSLSKVCIWGEFC